MRLAGGGDLSSNGLFIDARHRCRVDGRHDRNIYDGGEHENFLNPFPSETGVPLLKWHYSQNVDGCQYKKWHLKKKKWRTRGGLEPPSLPGYPRTINTRTGKPPFQAPPVGSGYKTPLRAMSRPCRDRTQYMRIYRETGLLASAAGSDGDSIGATGFPALVFTNRTSLITTEPKRTRSPS